MPKRVLPFILVLNCFAGSLWAQQRDLARSKAVGWSGELWSDVTPALTLQAPPELALFERRPFTDWVKEWKVVTDQRLAADRQAMVRGRRPAWLPETPYQPVAAAPTGPDTAYLPLLTVDTSRLGASVLPGVVGQYAKLGIDVRGRGELGGQWNRYDPCDVASQGRCNPGLFPQLKPDVLFGVAIGGTISERVHVNVDYDQSREFDAANNIHVFYQGLPDEVLQRVEVGDVSIRLPTSRFLTRGIPAGNFGFMASGQLGPMDFQTVFAQQKGDVTSKEFQLGGGGQRGLVQDAQLVIDDADYVKGQFFFLVEPRRLTGTPHFDVLALRPTDAPDAFRPATGGTIQLYRDERMSASSVQQSAQLGYFLANATPPGGGARHSGTFRRLIPEQDYYIHSSGLWVMLRSPLRADEALAASYVTQSGDTIGTYDAESSPAGVTPELMLLRGAATAHQPGSATWPLELHQVYRLDSSSDIDPRTIQLTVTLGEAAGGTRFRVINGQQVSFLRLFGLDEDAPVDQLDNAQIFQPGRDAPEGGTQPIGGTFIVLPTLQPFYEPAPVTSANVSAAQAKQALGNDSNAAIYEDADPVRRETATRFRLTFKYRVAVQGVVSSFSLGAIGIRQGSERLRFGGTELKRDVDYTIDYDLGQVQLLDPQTLFGANPGAQLNATWEQKPLFQVAPTSVLGLNTRFRLADRGELNFVGLYQAEKALMSRPQLGNEPGSIFLGGMGGRLDLGGALLEKVLNRLPGLQYNGNTSVRLAGELAFSTPNPNTRGAAYVDDFESSDEIRLEARRSLWKLGSRPQSTQGDGGALPSLLDQTTSAPLVWQHDYLTTSGPSGAVYAAQIDQAINTAGQELPETAMYLTLGYPSGATRPPQSSDPRRWRSLTQSLSTTGIDLSRSEYLEFYAADMGGEGAVTLLFDIGEVGEDAFYVDSLGRVNGNYSDNTRWGLGVADEEARLVQREVWSTELDRRGLWDQACAGDPTRAYALGDATSNCTRSNGLRDSEDLNGDGIVSTDDGQYHRFTVELGQNSPYLVRKSGAGGTGTLYALYRIPLRGAGAVPVNGATEAAWRFVRHLRLTMATEATTRRFFSVARMRIVGSRWTKRGGTGVVQGMLDADVTGSAMTQVRVGPVSQLTDGAKYQRPPFVEEKTQDPTTGIGATGIEYNERALRVAYDELLPGDRAETYFHYAQQPRNFLAYRQMRLWAVAREGEWGKADGERFLVKLGTDAKNYYLFQTRLKPATGPRAVTANDWLPEVVIEFQPWLALRAEAERRLVERGDQVSITDTVWSADSAYAMVFDSRARAPNLAAVRELSFAIFNAGTIASTGELWIDDLRLGAAEKQAGTAATFAVDVNAGDFLTGSFNYSRQGDVFRQLNEDPSYLATGDLSFHADARLDRFLPASWGVELPVSLSHTSSQQTPTFLSQSDVSAADLAGLRETGAGSTRLGVRLRKVTPTPNPILSAIVDGTVLAVGYSTADASAITSRSESEGLDASISYQRELAPRTFGVVPGFVEGALRALVPGAIERSGAFTRLVGSRFRWTPGVLGFTTGYGNQTNRSFLFSRILDLPGDSAVRPVESPRRALRNEALLMLQPFSALSASLTLTSDRDLLEANRSGRGRADQDALERARGGVAGLDLGWETNRSLGSRFSYQPVIADWLRVSHTWESRFSTGRDQSYMEYLVEAGDTTAYLQRRFDADRRTNTRVQLRTSDLMNAWFGRADSTATGFGATMRRHVSRLQPFELTWTGGIQSSFERELDMPSSGYMLGWGNLDAFRFISGDTAVRVQERGEFRASSGYALSRNAVFSVSYRESELIGISQRGGRTETHDRGWPAATLTLRTLPLGSLFPTSSVSMGVERVERSSLIGTTASPLARGSETVDLVPRVSLGIGRGKSPVTLAYDGRFSLGDSHEPTGRAEDFTAVHNLQATSMIHFPESMRARFRQPLNVALSLSQTNQQRCRVLLSAAAESCVNYVDALIRTGSLRLDTSLSDLRFGASIDYTSRDTYVGLRNGTNQFQLMMFGEFNFTAGQLPANFGGLR